MRAFHYYLPAFAALLFAGCGMDGPAPSDTKPARAQAAATPASTPKHGCQACRRDACRQAVAQRARYEAAVARPAAPQPHRGSPIAATQHPGMVREAAHVGMGEKGRGYGKAYIAVPLERPCGPFKEMMALDLIKHDMDTL